MKRRFESIGSSEWARRHEGARPDGLCRRASGAVWVCLLVLGTAAAMGLASAPAEAARGRIKCWTNDEGVRECGNVVPPKYAQKRHLELNRQGVVVKEQSRSKTREEIEAEERRAREEEARRREEARIAAEQAARDRVLLDTFTTEDDLVLAHRGRLAAIDSRIQHTERVVRDLEARLDALRREAADEERAGREPSEKLLSQIRRTEEQIGRNRAFIAARHREKEELDAQFRADLERYRYLRSAERSR